MCREFWKETGACDATGGAVSNGVLGDFDETALVIPKAK